MSHQPAPNLLHRLRPWLPLALVLLIGLALRLALWGNLPRQGMISDEAEYLASAAWLAQGRGFHWHQEWLWTRAPLYPLFLAAHIRLFGLQLAPIFATQTLLSLGNIALVYLLACGAPTTRHTRQHVPTLAALLAALYLPFATYPQMLLSETLYLTLLLCSFLVLKHWAQQLAQHHAPTRHTHALLVLAGVLLGFSALTRGLTLGFLPLVVGWAGWVAARATRQRRAALRCALPAMLMLALVCGGTILPWSLYASRLYGGTIVVDTTGAFNLLLGSRTAYDGERNDARTRNFVLALLHDAPPEARRTLLQHACLLQHNDAQLQAALQRPASQLTQAERQQLMTAEGLCLLRAKPAAFALKSLHELLDLFQINYTGAERMSGGFALGRLPPWYTLALFLLDDTLYVLLAPLAVVGWGRRMAHPTASAAHALTVLVGLWWLYNILTAPLLFAINRFRLPLLPFACIYAATLIERLPARTRRSLQQKSVLVGSSLLAALITLAALAPHAYLQGAEASSYLGPYPSSLAITRMALRERGGYLQAQRLTAALGAGDAATARRLLASGEVPTHTRELAMPLLAGLEGAPAAGLAMLPDAQTIAQQKQWRAAVVRGDLLRRTGDMDGVRAAFTPTYVDEQNPVGWAWQWLHPIPTNRIDLAGNRDLGYIQGFYLGEGDPTGGGTFRWSTGEARLFFPAQGSSEPQRLCLRMDGRGWPADMPMPQIRLLLEPAKAPQSTTADTADATSMVLFDDLTHGTAAPQPAALFATLQLQRHVMTACATLPATSPAADVVVLLQSPVFVPGAADLLSQQGAQASQLRLLGVRLDWAALR